MAIYTAARASGIKTLVANTADTVTLTSASSAYIEVKNWSATDRISFRNDGVDPVIDGPDNYIVGPGESLTVTAFAEQDVVKVISAGPAVYHIQGVTK